MSESDCEPDMVHATEATIAQRLPDLADEALARAALGGDHRAFTALVDRYRDTVFDYAYVRLGSREEAEDAAQEAFLRAFQSLGRFRSGGCWGAWLMTIARNLCMDALRRRKTRRAEPLRPEWADASPSPELLALLGERAHRLNSAIAALPDKDRVPLLMHYVRRRTYDEISLALGIRRSTVVGRLASALRRLRRELGKDL